MQRFEEELEAIDATLHGEAVDPEYAELAELALLLAGERPALAEPAADRLDAKVAARFGDTPARRRWTSWPGFGAAFAGALAVAVAGVIVVNGNSGQSSPTPVLSSASAGSSSGSSGSAGAGGSARSGVAHSAPAQIDANQLAPKAPSASAAPKAAVPRASGSTAAGSGASESPTATGPIFGPAAQTVAPTPPSNGRKITQSAQLALSTANNRIEQVAQEVFTVVGNNQGVVRSSQITAANGNGGYANFQLNIPSNNLAQTLTQLSTLRYAHVVSRTDATQDVNNQYLSDQRALADARALRTSLLKQLAAATTTTEIDSLKAQIHDAEASISSDEATLRSLNGRINFSPLQVTINSGGPIPIDSGLVTPPASSGFTLGKAAHDAVRVLTVAAGVALIALAALAPIALLAGLAAWIAATVRRRRREAALDSV